MSDFGAIHETLSRLMIGAAPNTVVATDLPGNLVLHTSEVDPKSGKPVWFGAVTVKKSYVAYHLFPLYAQPSLGEMISPALARRRQGKSCFNFRTEESELFAELATLTERAAAGVG